MDATHNCPNCGRPSSPTQISRIGTERARPFQFARNGANYFECPVHGKFSVRRETIESVSRQIEVIQNEDETYYVVD